MSVALEAVLVKRVGSVDYVSTWQAMRAFNAARTESTTDELWLLEHPPVYTFGQGADRAYGPSGPSAIPMVQTDRGGEVTYHGPGQVVVYTLVDLARRSLGVKRFVGLLEDAVLDLLEGRGERKRGAPGVYVDGAKVAALGIRVSRGRAYHGVALNVDMDLSPFAAIAPCGYPGLAVTHMRALGLKRPFLDAGERLCQRIVRRLEDA